MAQVVLTNVQKDLLGADPAFTQQVKWAILNKATFWKGVSGVAVPGGQTDPNLTKWAKARAFGAIVQGSPAIASASDNVQEFLIYAKDFPCVNDQVVFATSNVITYLLTDPINNFDSLSDKWFDAQVATTLF